MVFVYDLLGRDNYNFLWTYRILVDRMYLIKKKTKYVFKCKANTFEIFSKFI